MCRTTDGKEQKTTTCYEDDTTVRRVRVQVVSSIHAPSITAAAVQVRTPSRLLFLGLTRRKGTARGLAGPKLRLPNGLAEAAGEPWKSGQSILVALGVFLPVGSHCGTVPPTLAPAFSVVPHTRGRNPRYKGSVSRHETGARAHVISRAVRIL